MGIAAFKAAAEIDKRAPKSLAGRVMTRVATLGIRAGGLFVGALGLGEATHLTPQIINVNEDYRATTRALRSGWHNLELARRR